MYLLDDFAVIDWHRMWKGTASVCNQSSLSVWRGRCCLHHKPLRSLEAWRWCENDKPIKLISCLLYKIHVCLYFPVRKRWLYDGSSLHGEITELVQKTNLNALGSLEWWKLKHCGSIGLHPVLSLVIQFSQCLSMRCSEILRLAIVSYWLVPKSKSCSIGSSILSPGGLNVFEIS